MSMAPPFRYYLRVRFGECDPQRVVFNARYGDYVDLAVLECLRALGQGKSMLNGPLDYQVVKLTLEWRGSARFDQVLEVSVIPHHIGNTSFAFRCEFRVAGETDAIVMAEAYYVLVDAVALTKTPLPNEFRAALENGGRGLIVDHASSEPQSRP